MRQNILLQRIMAVILFSSLFTGCGTLEPQNTSTLTPVDPAETLSLTSTSSDSGGTVIPSASPSPRLTSTATPLPAWVADFSAPILAAIADRPPDFQEDFSQAGPGWYLETVNCPNNGCAIADGVLTVTAFPVDHKEAWAQQPFPSLAFKTFVMRVDVNTGKLGGENAASIFYNDTSRENGKFTTSLNYSFEIKSIRRWYSLIGPSGIYGYEIGQLPRSVSPQIIFTLISRGSRFAVYLNDFPVTYGEYAGGRYYTEFLLNAWSDGSGIARAEYDNFKVWNLDNIPNLP